MPTEGAAKPRGLIVPLSPVVHALLAYDMPTLLQLRDELRQQLARVEVEIAQIEDALEKQAEQRAVAGAC